MRKYPVSIAAIGLMFFVLLTNANAATLEVGGSGSYSQIQAAIVDAVNGDTVLVNDGTYVENINLLGKEITVQSVNGADATTIDGNNTVGVYTVMFVSGETSASVLDGFTVTNSSKFGMYLDASSPTIINCKVLYNPVCGIRCLNGSNPAITNCTAIGNGACSVYCNASSPSVTGCTLIGNGNNGVRCLNGSSTTVTDCTIIGNASNGVYGLDSAPTVTNCTIIGNIKSGVYLDNSISTVTNCTIIGNNEYGIYCSSSSPTVTNCTVSDNTFSGVECLNSSSPAITNCIIWDNAGLEMSVDATSGPVNVAFSDIDTADIAGAGTWSVTDSINADPFFVDDTDPDLTLRDYRLKVGSPCIDTGTDDTTTYPSLPSDDINGDARPLDLARDIGSDETIGTNADGDDFFSDSDCDDDDATIYPGAPEICGDGIDQDCDGSDATCPGFVVSLISGDTSEAGDEATFTVRLTTQPSADVTVTSHASNSEEAMVVGGASLVFTASDWDTDQTVTVRGVDDAIIDGNRFFLIILDPAVSGDPDYNGLKPVNVSGVNRDDEAGYYCDTLAAIDVTTDKAAYTPGETVTGKITFTNNTGGDAIVSVDGMIYENGFQIYQHSGSAVIPAGVNEYDLSALFLYLDIDESALGKTFFFGVCCTIEGETCSWCDDAVISVGSP